MATAAKPKLSTDPSISNWISAETWKGRYGNLGHRQVSELNSATSPAEPLNIPQFPSASALSACLAKQSELPLMRNVLFPVAADVCAHKKADPDNIAKAAKEIVQIGVLLDQVPLVSAPSVLILLKQTLSNCAVPPIPDKPKNSTDLEAAAATMPQMK